MSSDPFDQIYDYSDSAYDQLAEDAKRDDRVGDHRFLITDVVKDTWPDGSPRLKVRGNLVTANNAKADWTFSPPPPPDVVALEKGKWDKAKVKGIAGAVTLAKQLAEHYGKAPGKIVSGDEFVVKTAKTRQEADGSGGFIRIIAFLPKDHAVNGQAGGGTTAAPNVGF